MLCLRLLCRARIVALTFVVAVIVSAEQLTDNICDRFYTSRSPIGRGSYGRVFKGYNRLGPNYNSSTLPPSYAVKKFTGAANFNKEYMILRWLNRKFDRLPKVERRFSKVYGFCKLQIITDYMPEGILTLDNTVTADVDRIYGLAMAVSQIHSLGFVHLDLKPDNVRISYEGVVKLIDFGSAEDLWTQKNVADYILEATPAYMPPEVMRIALIPTSLKWYVDTWGVGMIAYEMLSRIIPFSFCSKCLREVRSCFSKHKLPYFIDQKILYLLTKRALMLSANEKYNDVKVNAYAKWKSAYSKWKKATKSAKDAYTYNDPEEKTYLNPEKNTIVDKFVSVCLTRCRMKSPRQVLSRELSVRVKRDKVAGGSTGWKPDIASLMVQLIFGKLLQFLPQDRASMGSVVEEMKTFWLGRAETHAKLETTV